MYIVQTKNLGGGKYRCATTQHTTFCSFASQNCYVILQVNTCVCLFFTFLKSKNDFIISGSMCVLLNLF